MRKPNLDKHSFYVRMYEAARVNSDKGNYTKVLFNGVMAVNTLPDARGCTKEQLEAGCKLIEDVQEILKQATPRQVMQAFPIHKEYDGAKWGMKDYFYTMDYLKRGDLDKPIGAKLEDFTWGYYNWNIMRVENMYDSYQCELECIEIDRKAKQFHAELESIAQDIKYIDEKLKIGVDKIKSIDAKIKDIQSKYSKYIQGRFNPIGLVVQVIINRLMVRRDTHKHIIWALNEAKENKMVEYGSVDGWDEYIEALSFRDRNKANEAIITRNRLLNKCWD